MISRTLYESSINSYQRIRDGWVDYLALCQHNIGSSKWDEILEYAKAYVKKRERNRYNHRFDLRYHIGKHSEANNETTRASQHVQYEIPNEHMRVGCFIKSISSNKAVIVSAITHIQGPQVQRNEFETAAEFLLLPAPTTKSTPSNQIISLLQRNTKTLGNLRRAYQLVLNSDIIPRKNIRGYLTRSVNNYQEREAGVIRKTGIRKTAMIRMLSRHYSNR